MEILVFGAGSLGSLIGGLLAREQDVVLVGREPHVSQVDDRSLQITGEITARVHPEATTEPPDSADLGIVTVKAFDTEAAARTLTSVDLDVALSLQNGMGNEARLASELSCPVLAGTCTYGARLERPGAVACTGIGEIVVGERDGGPSDLADDVGGAFDSAGIETTVAEDMPRRLWKKLAVNAGINPTSALARVPNGALVDGPAAETARSAAREVARVAQADGIDLAQTDAAEAVLDVAEATAANRSSMYQDVANEKRTEIDAINGYVAERADRSVPVNETLARLVRTWERNQNLRAERE